MVSNIKLSKNFTLAEMTKSDTAEKLGISNKPNIHQIDALFYLCQFELQPIRDRWGRIKISSGYRCRDVNSAVGGSLTSQHLMGEAADIIPLDAPINEVYNWAATKLNYGQIIIYDDLPIIHISLPRLYKPNRDALIRENGAYRPQVANLAKG